MFLPNNNYSVTNLAYRATPGTHAGVIRLSYVCGPDEYVYIKGIYLRINNATVPAGAVNGIVTARYVIGATNYVIDEIIMPAVGAFTAKPWSIYDIRLGTTAGVGDRFDIVTNQPGVGNAEYVLTAQLWRYT